MHISKFQLNNFKSYLASSEIELSPGFNIIVGQNNVGKTALLEALRLNFGGIAKPHRSLQTLPSPDAVFEPNSWADVSIIDQPRRALRYSQESLQNIRHTNS